MATIPCANPCVVCEPGPGGGIGPVDPANPFANLSSELPDVDSYIGRRYSIGLPPLGNNWYAVGCIGWCLSTVSQAEADNCAAIQAVLCQGTVWPDYVPGPNPDYPFIPQDRPIYYSSAQYCDYPCPDGSTFRYTVPAGTFATVLNQETADLMAYSYACNQAINSRICIGELLVLRTCSNAAYSGYVTSTSARTPITWTVIGSLPPGLDLTTDTTTAYIAGTPTTPGEYTFTLVATDPDGVSAQKSFTMDIFGVATDSPMPDGDVDVPYSEILAYGGTAVGAVTWSVTAGALPTGLTLDSATGEISGTPTVDGVFLFTITASDES